jgi:hypothetical protein
VAALILFNVISALRTGRALSMWTGAFTRTGQPRRFWRFIYANCAILLLYVGLILWALIWPETFRQ